MTALKKYILYNSIKFSTAPLRLPGVPMQAPALFYYKLNCDMLAAQQQLYLIKKSFVFETQTTQVFCAP